MTKEGRQEVRKCNGVVWLCTVILTRKNFLHRAKLKKICKLTGSEEEVRKD